MTAVGRLPNVQAADCTAAEAVGDPVYISSAAVGDRWQVRTTDYTDFNKMPAVGVIIDKPTATTCVVQVGGEVSIYTGLTVGRKVFVSISGIEQPPVSRPLSGVKYVQSLGVATGTTTVAMNVGSSMVRIRP